MFQVAILSQKEDVLGFLNPGEDQIEIGNKSTDLFDVLLNMEKEKNVVDRD